MILWIIITCAVVGFALGAHCRLFPLAAVSALIVACWPLMPPASESALLSEGLTILVLLVVLQAFFLAGAVWRVSSPRAPFPQVRPSLAARLRGSGS